jgi:hypothetical protein
MTSPVTGGNQGARPDLGLQDQDRVPWDSEKDALYKVIYEKCCQKILYKIIIMDINKSHPGSIKTPQGIRHAARRYAEVHNLSSIPSRQKNRTVAEESGHRRTPPSPPGGFDLGSM